MGYWNSVTVDQSEGNLEGCVRANLFIKNGNTSRISEPVSVSLNFQLDFVIKEIETSKHIITTIAYIAR